jgi:ABC-type nitrate/sulfonate/bicarbonate transport system permease component
MSREVRIGVLSLVSVLGLWELLVDVGVLRPIIASSPLRIAAAAATLLADPEFVGHIRVSATEFVIGFTSASVLGAILGLLAGWYRRIGYAVDPLVTVLYVTPRVALLPVLVLWLGLGPASTTAVVFLGAFFMVFLNTMAGVKTLDPALLRAARSFMASDRTIFRTIVLPGTFPFLITGLRLGVGRALIGVLIGELFAAAAGLGYFIHITAATLQIDRMFVAVLLISLAGLATNGLLSLAERRIEHWRPAIREL